MGMLIETWVNALEKGEARNLIWFEQQAGTTIYMPYGWGHLVYTPPATTVTTMISASIQFVNNDVEYESRRERKIKIAQHCPVGLRTQDSIRGEF
jgi:hypothetical protein